ncbi:MAG: heme o synthase [Candidatus Pacebacteria bacterium]|nr:heme o synthase [Candidatus Paceibacterota bacterium]
MFKAYYRLTKPGIVYGNVFTVIAGFLFASHFKFAPFVLLSVVVGMALVIAGSCVFNNVLDRGVDAKMERTKSRALVTGLIGVRGALVYGGVLVVVGISVLVFGTNALSAGVALFGVIFYVLIYGYAKRASQLGTIVGSVAGAVPILAGYTAFANRIDTPGVILFLALVLWQMPHFYAIAIYRLKDYTDAGIPVLPAMIGVRNTKFAIIAYIIVFVLAEISLFVIGEVGYLYVAIICGYGIAWLSRAVSGLHAADDVVWAKGVFLFSVQVLIAFSVAISLGRLFL